MPTYKANSKLKFYRGASKLKGYRGAAKIFGGEPYDDALALVGYSAASLDAALKNSAACAAMAANTDARSIMKSNYSSQMVNYITNNYNNGLNKLNYACRLKCYLLKSGVDVSSSLGYAFKDETQNGSWTKNSGYVTSKATNYSYAYRYTTTKFNASSYTKISAIACGKQWSSNQAGYFGTSANQNTSAENEDNTFGYLCYKAITGSAKTTFDFTIPTSRVGSSFYVKYGTAYGASGYGRTCDWYDIYFS